MKRLLESLLMMSAALAFASCQRTELDPTQPIEHQHNTPHVITVHTSLEEPVATKTQLGKDNCVAWTADDSFSVLTEAGVGSPMSLSELNALADNSSLQVILVNASTTSGCVLGASGSSTSTYGSGMASADGMLAAAKSKQSDETYVMTLVKVNGKFRIRNSSNYYLYRTSSSTTTSGYTWSTSTSYVDYSISNPSSAIASNLASGCNNSNCIQFSMSNSKGTATYYLNASTLSESTLTTTHDAAVTAWYVYPIGADANEEFTIAASGAGQTSADFTGSVTDENAAMYALYPYRESNTYSDGTISFQLPATQHYQEGNMAEAANPSFGRLAKSGDDFSVEFKNLCGLLKLSLIGTDVVTSIAVTDKTTTNSLWGTASFSTQTDGDVAATVSGGSNTITLDCGGGVQLNPQTATVFYIVVPVGSFTSGMDVALTTYYGSATKSTTADNTINRSFIKSMPTFSTATLTYEVPEFNLVNPTAADYMANSYSTFTSGSSSYLNSTTFRTLRSNALSSADCYRNDQPNTKLISFSKEGASTATVTMATDSQFANTVLSETVSLSSGQGSYRLRNMVPGTTYYYQVTSGEEMLTAGAFKATGQLRMIRIDDSWNIRDLGGWTGYNGNKVRYEMVYRGGSLGGFYNNNTDKISEESGKELARIGLKAHLDLRPSSTASSDQMGWVGSTTGSYCLGYSPIPGADFKQIVADWGMRYPFKSPTSVGDVAYVIKSLKEGRPVYFHCRTGADRTGTVAYLLLGLLGCDSVTAGNNGNQIAMDYELTSLSMDEDNTILYIKNGTLPSSYSDRLSNNPGYALFSDIRSLSASGYNLNDFQQRCYYYLNRYFADNTSSIASNSYISKENLDWFINFMLGIINLDGTIAEGHTEADKYVGPTWAQSFSTPTLDDVIDNAVTNQYEHS